MPAQTIRPAPRIRTSPLVICDSLLALAELADGAGLDGMAEQLLALAYSVLDGPLTTRTRFYGGLPATIRPS